MRRQRVYGTHCRKCGAEKETGRKHHWCKLCCRDYERNHQRDRDARNAAARTPERRAKANARTKARYADDPTYWINKEHIQRARRFKVAIEPCDLNAVYAAAGHKCQMCGVQCEGRNRTIDHKVPFSRGGGHTMSNLQLLCLSCNSKKNDRTPEEVVCHLGPIPTTNPRRSSLQPTEGAGFVS